VPISPRLPSVATAIVLPVKSLAEAAVDVFATTMPAVGTVLVYAPAGAMKTKFSPRSCACASERAFEEPASIVPEATAAAIAGPLASATSSTSEAGLLEEALIDAVIGDRTDVDRNRAYTR